MKLIACAFALLCLTPAAEAQTNNAFRNMQIHDTRQKASPVEDAARHLGKAERALRKADKLEAKYADETLEKTAKKIEKQYRTAAREAEIAVRKDTTLVDAYVILGQASLALSEAEEGRKACRVALSLENSRRDAAVCLLEACLTLGHIAEGKAAYNTIEPHDPEGASALRQRVAAWVAAHPEGPISSDWRAWLERMDRTGE